MEPGTLILIVGAILLAAVAAATLAGRAGVPVLVAFLGLGMVLGSEGVGGIDFADVHLARTVGIVGGSARASSVAAGAFGTKSSAT